MKKPFFSVVVPTLNSETTIGKCVRSLVNQNYPKDKYEIIFIDNGSTDNTYNILQKFSKRIRILHESKKGAYYARNKGIKNAKGDIIVFTDSDCIVDRNWLLHLNMAFKHKRVKIVGGRTKSLKKYNSLLKYCDKFCNTQELYFKCQVPYFSGGNLAIRKKNLECVGGFDTSIESGGDNEICHRLIQNRNEAYYEPKAIVYHLYADSLIKFMRKSYYYGKWHKYRKKNHGITYTIKMPSYFSIFKKNGITFLFLRILQDLSYRLGFIFGA